MSSITEAASVVLADGSAAEVLVVRRSNSLRFFGGYLAFPGGKVSPDDQAVSVRTAAGPLTDPRRSAAVRELFEETGVLLARRADNSFPPPSETITQARRELLADALPFSTFLDRAGLHLDAADLLPAGSLVTPPFSPIRFDTAFFVAQLPPGQTVEVWPGELSDGRWTTARLLLDEWARGECQVTPPTVTILEQLRDRSALDLPERLAPLLARLDAGAIPAISFAPGVHMLPLHTVAFPPAQYTNAFLVGTDDRWLIDPGAHEPQEQERFFESLDALLAVGGRFAGILVTHWHPDHVGGVAAAVERYRVPVWAHPITARTLEGQLRIDHFLEEGDRVELGTAPDGSGPWHLEPLLTPGHAAGHLAFYEPHYRLLFAADLVSPLTSIVIAPPDGDLGAYLASLRRVREFDFSMLLPSHGSPSLRGRELLDQAMAHREKRESQMVAALAEMPAGIESLTGRLYTDLQEPLRTLARLQVQCGLEKLRREGRVVEDRGSWFVVHESIES